MIKKAIAQYLLRNKLTAIQLKAVLFDMDGVLFDSMPYHTQSWYDTITAIGIPCTMEEFYLFEGRTGESTINELFLRTYNRTATEEEKKEIYKDKSNRFNAFNTATPMHGAADVIKKVNESKLDTLIVTGSGQLSLIEKLEKAYPNQFKLDKMVTAEHVIHGKPHPEPYLLGLEKAGVKANEAVVIENAPLGVAAASAAGIFTIAANTGPLDEQVLYDAGADIVFPDMEAVASAWKELIDAMSAQ